MTSDVLEQVQTQILPQAEHSQQESLRSFRDEFIQLLSKSREDHATQLRLKSQDDQIDSLSQDVS